MASSIATVKELCAALDRGQGAASLRVTADGRDLASGFHVTEIQMADVNSLDCGGRHLAWSEAAVQILDSGTGRPMEVGTLRAILGKAQDVLPGIGALPLRVDADPGGTGLRRYQIADVKIGGGAVTLSLQPDHAACKPAVESKAAGLPNCRSVGCCA